MRPESNVVRLLPRYVCDALEHVDAVRARLLDGKVDGLLVVEYAENQEGQLRIGTFCESNLKLLGALTLAQKTLLDME
jgi:hypothetical protein